MCYGFATFKDRNVTRKLLQANTCRIRAVELILHSCEEYQKLCQPIYSNKGPSAPLHKKPIQESIQAETAKFSTSRVQADRVGPNSYQLLHRGNSFDASAH